MIRNFKYRLYPTKGQIKTLDSVFGSCRFLYNSALEHRREAYRIAKKSINYYDQANELPLIKDELPQLNLVHSLVLQDVLKRVDLAFKGFFRRVKIKKDGCGFPRFKGKDRFNSITYIQSGFKFTKDKRRITLSKIGDIKVKLHREIPDGSKIKTCTIKREGRQWYCILSCDIPLMPRPKTTVQSAVGIDLGLTTFAVLSNGAEIGNPKFLKASEERLKRAQEKYSKKKTHFLKNQLSRLHRKVANQRRDFQHKTARTIVSAFDLIAYEDLKVKEMMERKNGINLNKHIGDASWSSFIAMLKYKAEDAGKYAVAVNPRGTSQRCSKCGGIVKKDLFVRVHSCPCGFEASRDHNASLNILASGVDAMKKEAPCFSLG